MDSQSVGSMLILSLDTATDGFSVALGRDGDRFSRFERVNNTHGQRLPQMVNSVLAEANASMADLSALVCGQGPGSFSGVRIAVAYAKGVSAGLGKPLHGISSLALLAQGLRRKHQAELVLAATDARMGQVYLGLYEVVDGRVHSLMPDCVCDPEQVEEILPFIGSRRISGGGSGWARYEPLFREGLPADSIGAVDASALPDAWDALDLVDPEDLANTNELTPLTPRYLRDRVALTREEQEAARRSRSRSNC